MMYSIGCRVVIISLFLAFSFGLRSNLPLRFLSRHRPGYAKGDILVSCSQNDIPDILAICNGVAVPGNSTKTLVNLINLGDEWASKCKRRADVDNSGLTSFLEYNARPGEKVPGCMADVRITTSVRSSSSGVEVVSIEGSADSRVAQGMLAMLVMVSISYIYMHLKRKQVHMIVLIMHECLKPNFPFRIHYLHPTSLLLLLLIS